jgi:hypothetical protein
MAHMVYGAIVAAVKSGRLREPFSKEDFRAACPGPGLDGGINVEAAMAQRSPRPHDG